MADKNIERVERKEMIKHDMQQYAETIMDCSSCRHMGVCEYMKSEIKEKRKEYECMAENEIVQFKENNIMHTSDINLEKAKIYKKYENMLNDWKSTVNNKCFYEIKIILDLLRDFETYDLNDPAMKLAVKTLVSNLILGFRIDIIMKHHDIMMDETRMTNSGDSYSVQVANPLIKYKNEINKQILDTSEKLYKLVHGTKQVQETKVSIYDILSKSKPEVKEVDED